MSVEKLLSQIKVTREGLLLIAAVFGVAVSIVNFLVLNQLTPVISSLQSLTARVTATEEKLSDTSPLVERFLGIEQKVKDIDTRTTRIENKLDRLVSQ